MSEARESKHAAALWYVGPGAAEIRDEALTSLAPDRLRVRTRFSALSRGTERVIASGRVPETEYARMRAPHMAGDFPFPVKYGYAAVGVVEDGPAEWQGRRVFALHPHQSRFDIALGDVVEVPYDVPDERATLAANMETALNAIWDAAPGPADRIGVVGAGVVGALCAFLCARLPGAQVTLIDAEPGRAGIASLLGAEFALPAQSSGDCDLVIHASGTGEGLAAAFALAGDEATVVELSWYGTRDVTMPLGGAFHSRRLKLVSSQVGRVAPSRRPRWTHARRRHAAMALLRDPCLDALLAPAVAFAEAPARLPELLHEVAGPPCRLIAYP